MACPFRPFSPRRSSTAYPNARKRSKLADQSHKSPQKAPGRRSDHGSHNRKAWVSMALEPEELQSFEITFHVSQSES